MMNNILFACDLDNTLIHSWKYRKDGDICVEWIDGKEQGYMSERVCDMLRHVIEKVDFVPVTTRSVAQYQRIVWPQGCAPQSAITTHGAKLLTHGNIDPEWEKETAKTTDAVIGVLESIVSDLDRTEQFLRCRMVDHSYAFVYCKETRESAELAGSYPIHDLLYRISSGKKVYFIPKGIDKGTAVRRYAQNKDYRSIICAGDSDMDLSMLVTADIAFVPDSLGSKLQTRGKKVLCDNKAFPEKMLEGIINML